MLMNVLKKTPVFRTAEKVKNLYFEKLDSVLSKLQDQEQALASLAANDSSVLQALAYLVEKLREEQRARQHRVSEVERQLATVQSSLEALRRSLESTALTRGGVGTGETARER